MKKFSEEDILDLLGNLPNQPSKYQMNFYSDLMNTDFNLNINAVAGSGKTTTIVNSLRLIPLNKRVIFLAFNNSIVDELKNRCPSHVQVTTIHSLGWRKSLDYYEKIDLIEGKVWNWCKKILKYKIPKVLQAQYFNTISQVVNLMRCDLVESFEEIKTLMEKHGILLSDNQIEDVMSIYELVKEDTTTFDFCDMIFQPAIETAIRFSKYDYVFVDEAQDLNRAQHKLIEKLIGTQTRLVSVGDPFQAIYSFAGADAESFEYFKNRPNTKNLPLSISYRCAKNIVLKAQELVPHIEYSENARLGTARDGSVSEIQEGDFVLCRNVMPLVLLCVEFMRRGKRARIKGSADMVKKISSLLELIDEPNYRKAVGKLAKHLVALRKDLIKSGFNKPEFHPKFIRTREYVQIILYLGKGIENTKQITTKLKQLFVSKEDNGIILSTIHKSKGLENDRVFLICPELLPSSYAITSMQLQQEKNLEYVAYTRAIKTLIIVDDFSEYVTDYRSVARKEEKKFLSN